MIARPSDPERIRAMAYALVLVRVFLGDAARKIQWSSPDAVIAYADSIARLVGTMPEEP